jgi:hypothetical protein
MASKVMPSTPAARNSLVGANQAIGVSEEVRPLHLIAERVETKGRFVLGLAVQRPLQCPDALTAKAQVRSDFKCEKMKGVPTTSCVKFLSSE